MKWVLLVLPLVAGCGATLPERVEIPVPVACIRADQVPTRPALATEQLKPGASVHEKTKAVLAENRQLRAYVGELEALLEPCSDVSPVAPGASDASPTRAGAAQDAMYLLCLLGPDCICPSASPCATSRSISAGGNLKGRRGLPIFAPTWLESRAST